MSEDEMSRSARLPARFPVGSKYVLESRGSFVQRYVEFPDGRRVRLSTRKALPCECWEQISIVPHQQATPVDAKNERGANLKSERTNLVTRL
jgi:hypothetical protein